MYTLTIQVESAEKLAEIANLLAGQVPAEGKKKKAATTKKDEPPPAPEEHAEKNPAENAEPETVKSETPVVSMGAKLVEADGTPLTKEEDLDKAKEFLRGRLTESNKAGNMDRNRGILAKFDGAKSITVLDPKHYVAFYEAFKAAEDAAK